MISQEVTALARSVPSQSRKRFQTSQAKLSSMIEYDDNGMPLPDGHIKLEFIRTAPIVEMTYPFKDLDVLEINEMGIAVRYKDRRRAHPWGSIWSYDHVFNSDEYVAKLKVYQDTHEHNWICTGDDHTAVDIPGFYWCCGPAAESQSIVRRMIRVALSRKYKGRSVS
jgi:hypothetical protein